MRAVTSREIGIESPEREAVADTGRSGRVLFVDNRPASHERIAAMLAEGQCVDVEADPSEALFRAADGNYDLLTHRSVLNTSMRCGCAPSSARSTAPAISRFSPSPSRTAMPARCAVSKSA
jgi:hypothetical protein